MKSGRQTPPLYNIFAQDSLIWWSTDKTMMVVNLGYEVLILGDYGLNVDKVYSKVGEVKIFSLDQPSWKLFSYQPELGQISFENRDFYGDLHFQM